MNVELSTVSMCHCTSTICAVIRCLRARYESESSVDERWTTVENGHKRKRDLGKIMHPGNSSASRRHSAVLTFVYI